MWTSSQHTFKPFISLEESLKIYLNAKLACLIFGTLLGGKYQPWNFTTMSSQVIMEPEEKELSHLYATLHKLNRTKLAVSHYKKHH